MKFVYWNRRNNLGKNSKFKLSHLIKKKIWSILYPKLNFSKTIIEIIVYHYQTIRKYHNLDTFVLSNMWHRALKVISGYICPCDSFPLITSISISNLACNSMWRYWTQELKINSLSPDIMDTISPKYYQHWL